MHEERRALWHLRKLPLFASLRSDLIGRLAKEVTLEEARKRRVIYMPGDPGDVIYFVNSGRVKISRVTSDGKELTLFYRGAGEMFGELCLIDGGPREEMAEVMDTALITIITRERFENLINDHIGLTSSLALVLCEQRRALERKMEDIVFKDVSSKLAELLVRLADKHGVEDEQGTLLSVKITHQEMANLIGSTRETVSLTLSQFKKKQLITTRGRKVIVTDRVELEALMS